MTRCRWSANICAISRDISRANGSAIRQVPAGYFDAETENKLAVFERRARVERRPALSTELPDRALREDIAIGAAATLIFRNWLRYLSGDAADLVAHHA